LRQYHTYRSSSLFNRRNIDLSLTMGSQRDHKLFQHITPSSTIKSVLKVIGVIFVPLTCDIDVTAVSHVRVTPWHVSSVQADSTGKLSTKLTARRRYRPRIIDAIPIFNDFISDKTPIESAQTYLSSQTFQDLVRGMRLYGLSLRKGETLDDISREVERITNTFVKDCEQFSSKQSYNNEQLKTCAGGFKEYVSFTEVEK